MKIHITSKLLIILILTALVPLSIVGWVGYRSTLNISQIASQANREVAELAMSDSSAALSAELKTRLLALTERHAGDVNEILKQVQGDTVKLADFGTYLYNHAETLKRYALPSTYEPAPEHNSFGSRQENRNSWLAVFGNGVDGKGQVSKETLKEIQLTEYMDILFNSIAATNPYAVQMYINTAGQLSRGMPFVNGEFSWVDGPKQFSQAPDVTAFDFYYLADAAHNPDRGPEWTELYWDPAGLGWMVSSIAPVYRGEKLVAVTGIDITLDQIVKGILNLQVEESGFAFLMSRAGQAIAFPERASEFLEFQGSFEGEFKRNEAFAHQLTKVRDPAFQRIVAAMSQGAHELTTYTDAKTGKEYFLAYHPIPVTGWSVAIAVPVQEVIAPALLTNQKIEQSRERTATMLNARAQSLVETFLWLLFGIVLALIPVALVFARSISRPIHQLAEGSRRVGAGELDHRIQLHSGDEIEDLAVTFNQMADDLQAKIDEIETANLELLELDQLKSKFISMASHELRTPLIAIQGYVDLIREGKGGEISPAQHKMLDTVSRNATRLARIVAELLDISRIEENKLVLERMPVSLSRIVREIADEQQPYLDSRGHTLTLELAEDLPLVNGDLDRLSQVVINLLGNAVKYTPDGGQIKIAVQARDGQVHLEVSDNGIGIRQEDLGKLFKRFSTLGDITKHRTGKNEFMAGGTGLGLSIVQGIVQAHEGEIQVESEYGQGSTFRVILPIAADQTPLSDDSVVRPPRVRTADESAPAFKVIHFEQPEEPQIDLPEDQRLSILVVDDEADVITFTRDLLEERYTILSALTSATAIREAISRKPDLVLLDAWIPGISGYDICRTLKRNSNTRDTPIIIFTAATQQIDEQRAREAGADGFVTKPFRREQMIELIESFRGRA
ncbi:ATP-binding protein [uncultured Thiocystis sp.]|jgi:signal transduction histidine kinase/CheY-like chemotaxis protein|uniref:hybrid sensor histidine kinase/response regulator n=1 Tax=uncultured Thiocystis sp. TaxID=1202134 RepID=UPI0025F79879|nr:ATP-binding protein [uncultured Thiocystis sp.]